MRNSCFDCARKHLAQALVISMELRYYAGDPDDDHLWVCIGHLAEAADQIQKKSGFIADKIREQRLLLMQEGSEAVGKLNINNLIQLVTELSHEPEPGHLPEPEVEDLLIIGDRLKRSNGSV